MMAVIIDLPFQDKIDQSSGAKAEGFALNIIRYGSKVSQLSFMGADAESSREEDWVVNYPFIEYATPAEVLGGKTDELKQLRDFYKTAQLALVRWRPFEYESNRIWRIKPNSLKIKQVAGCNFKATLQLEFLYTE
ncbi:hypothetical protein COPG_00057 [Colwellia phage 9A]|uniref:Uncharacterized protein n=1 Tax=Colwellia phage 9A TaxID=765765 RepID=I3UMD8_9CAUD|nr:hypothetical protein COPG_00057 [Colwellia phage 9A]AFK66653.1 hypothetical protein COPG_00057 [Colwellia phage 9A]